MPHPNFFNIKKYTKPGKDMVIELDDEVEYIIDSKIIQQIKAGEKTVLLIRVVDDYIVPTSLSRIVSSLEKNGPIDYLDIK